MRPILLDTCAALWLTELGALSQSAERALIEINETAGSILVSPITAWEVGILVSKGRMALSKDPKRWFAELLRAGVTLAALPPDVLIESSSLPGGILRDPADRIVAATARAFDYRLMTRDGPLLSFAAAGHMQAVAC